MPLELNSSCSKIVFNYILLSCSNFMHLLCSAWQLEVVKPLEDKTVIAGEPVEFTCVLNEAVPESEVAWYANSVELQRDDDWTMRASGCSYSLILKKAKAQPTQEITFAARDALSMAKLTTICKGHFVTVGILLNVPFLVV